MVFAVTGDGPPIGVVVMTKSQVDRVCDCLKTMATNRHSLSEAGRILGSVRSLKKSASSRRNGTLGGRPSSGLCTLREYRRRYRSLCHSSRCRYVAGNADALRAAYLRYGRNAVAEVMRSVDRERDMFTRSALQLLPVAPVML